MLPKTDMFNQEYYRSDDGFIAIICYEGTYPEIDVYTPQGEWCGNTKATRDASRLADIKHIIKNRIVWENRLYNS